MASFQVHVDQENNVSNLRKSHAIKKTVLQKRPVLGRIDSNSINVGSSQINLKKDEKKIVTSKSCKPVFKIQEDKRSEGTQAVLQAIEKGKIRIEKKKSLEENKDKITKDECKQAEFATNFNSLPQHLPLKEISNKKKESEDDKVSDSSFASDECQMSLDKSLVNKLPELTISTRITEAIYDLDEYREDIFKYLLQAEDRNRPRANYMRRQPDITYSMRTILVDWLVEVTLEYHLHSETLHIAIFIIDRFLSLMSVVRGKLQLLGTAAMFIASKYEEIYPPEVGEFVYITDETYTKKQVIRMEHLILKVLMFDVSVPTSLTFIQIICISCNQSEKVKHLASYLCELTLLEGDPYLNSLPSVVASSAIALARFCLDEDEPWTAALAEFSGYSLDKLALVIGYLNDTHAKCKSIPYQTIQEKYKSRKYQKVSEIEHKQFIVIPSSSV